MKLVRLSLLTTVALAQFACSGGYDDTVLILQRGKVAKVEVYEEKTTTTGSATAGTLDNTTIPKSVEYFLIGTGDYLSITQANAISLSRGEPIDVGLDRAPYHWRRRSNDPVEFRVAARQLRRSFWESTDILLLYVEHHCNSEIRERLFVDAIPLSLEDPYRATVED